MRIAFIALSGVRAWDQELMRLGLTFPGVLDRSSQVAQLPSLGLLTLAGMTPQHHEVHYHEIGHLDADALPGPYDLVALSGLTAQIKQAYAIADRYRALGTRVVIGGLHVTARPEEAQAHVDAVVIGEGESVWLSVVADAERGELQPVYDARKQPFSLDEAPMPAYELLDEALYNRVTVQTSRGCPHKCSFCASSILLTPLYKQKPMERVLAEIDRVRELWRRPFFELADDNSFVNRKYWHKLLPELEKRKIRWFTEADIAVGDDPEFLAQLYRAGCKEVLIGLESSQLDELDGIEVRANWKKKRQHTYLENIRRIQAAGIRVNGCFIFGLDGQTPDVFERVYRFAAEARLFDVQLTLLTPFPGTPLYEQYKKSGRLLHDGEWERFTLFDVNFVPSSMSADELTQGFRDLVVRMYDPEFQRQRRSGFRFERRRSRALGTVSGSEPHFLDVPNGQIPREEPELELAPASPEAYVGSAARHDEIARLARLKQDLEHVRRRLLAHPLYREVDDSERLRTFMESHAFAVWDFMSLTKRLQRELTCVELPWRPAKSPMLARFINDVVLTEESDIGPDGEPTSHLELYLRGMDEVGADSGRLRALLAHLERGRDLDAALGDVTPPAGVRPFVAFTLEKALFGAPEEVAAMFLCSREDIIPEMFERLVSSQERGVVTARHFRYYLERHIHLDAEEHGPMAEQLLCLLAGNDEDKWQRATLAAHAALEQRIALWDAIRARLPVKKKSAPLLVLPNRRRTLPLAS